MKALMTPALTALALLTATAAQAVTFSVDVDTTSLEGSAGYVVFDLLGGAPAQNNVLTVSAFTTDGSLGVGSGTGGFAGNLTPGPLTLDSAGAFFSEWLQPLDFGTRLGLQFSVDDRYVGGTPDNFSLYLLDATSLPFPTSDPSGSDAALSLDMLGNGGAPVVYASAYFGTTVAQVPELPSAALLMLGFAALSMRALPRLGRGAR